MSKTQLFSKLGHHEILKMATVISDDSLRDSKLSDDMIEYEQGCIFSGIIECRHHLDPFSEIIHGYDDVSMPPDRVRVTCHEVNAPFCERTNGNYRV
jgi:hypothetical protein